MLRACACCMLDPLQRAMNKWQLESSLDMPHDVRLGILRPYITCMRKSLINIRPQQVRGHACMTRGIGTCTLTPVQAETPVGNQNLQPAEVLHREAPASSSS